MFFSFFETFGPWNGARAKKKKKKRKKNIAKIKQDQSEELELIFSVLCTKKDKEKNIPSVKHCEEECTFFFFLFCLC